MIRKEIMAEIYKKNSDSEDVVSLDKVQAQDKLYDLMLKLIREEAELHSLFWAHAKEMEVSATELQKAGHQIEDKNHDIKKAWEKSDDPEVPRSLQFYFLYGTYCIMLRNNPADGLLYC